MSEYPEVKIGQKWRRVKGVQPGKVVHVVEIGRWNGVVEICWKGVEGGRGALLESDWHSRYVLID